MCVVMGWGQGKIGGGSCGVSGDTYIIPSVKSIPIYAGLKIFHYAGGFFDCFGI